MANGCRNLNLSVPKENGLGGINIVMGDAGRRASSGREVHPQTLWNWNRFEDDDFILEKLELKSRQRVRMWNSGPRSSVVYGVLSPSSIYPPFTPTSVDPRSCIPNTCPCRTAREIVRNKYA